MEYIWGTYHGVHMEYRGPRLYTGGVVTDLITSATSAKWNCIILVLT